MVLRLVDHQVVTDFIKEWGDLDDRLKGCEIQIREMLKTHEVCRVVDQLQGIGPVTATALVATIGNPSVFKNGRQVSSYFGLVPGHKGTGGKIYLKGISKRGDKYIRKLLVHGGRSMVLHAENKTDLMSRWITQLVKKRGFNKACVAVANKNARMCWAVMKKHSRGEATTILPPRNVAGALQ